jgi:hypothetical protein
LYNKIISKKKKKGGAKTMDIRRSTLYYHQAKDNLNKKIKETDIKKKIRDLSLKPVTLIRSFKIIIIDKLIQIILQFS